MDFPVNIFLSLTNKLEMHFNLFHIGIAVVLIGAAYFILSKTKSTSEAPIQSSNQHPFLGSYLPADSYVNNQLVDIPTGQYPAAKDDGKGTGFGLDEKSLGSVSSVSDGLDNVLISAPQDYLYADNLGDDVNVLTTNRNQAWDLRGEPAIAPVFSQNENGQLELGPFGGAFQSSIGAFEFRKPIRTIIA
jgi:hypothetical protein